MTQYVPDPGVLLNDLLEQITEENMHEEVDFWPLAGRELSDWEAAEQPAAAVANE